MSQPLNFLLLTTDQERYDVVGANGSVVCRTPNLDRVAAEGVRFENAFVPTALCSPSRVSLLTGLFPHAHGVLNNTHGPDALARDLDPDIPTFPEMLRDAGYRLGFVGKWHAGWEQGPSRRGFHDVVGGRYDVEQAEADRPLTHVLRARFPHGSMTIAGVDPRPIEETDAYGDATAAIGLLERYAAAGQSFLLRLDLEGPHHPYMPPEPFASLYEPEAIPPWPGFHDNLAAKPVAQQRLRAQRGVEGLRTWSDWQPLVARYLGYMTFIDSQIGRVLDALDGLKLADRTVVVHTADHGDMTGSHGGQFNKGPLMYDDLYRVPLMVRGPGISTGVASQPVSTMDLTPTILQLAGIDPPAGLHGRSLLDLLRRPGREGAGRDAVFAEFHGDEWGLFTQRMVRTRTAKYVYSPRGTDELYDLERDPHELHNLAGDPAARPLLEDLQARLVAWMKDTADPLWGWARRIMP